MIRIARYSLILTLSAAPVLCQTAASTAAATPASTPAADASLATLLDSVANQNKALQEEIKTQKALAKKNEEILKSVTAIQQDNQKLLDAKKKIEAQNAELLRQSESLRASLKSSNPETEVKTEWASKDIGGVTLPGTFTNEGGLMTVSGAGEDIWGAKDQFRYSYMPVKGDCAMTVHITSESSASRRAKAGIMVRESLAEDSPNVFATISPGKAVGVALQSRSAPGAITASLPGPDNVLPPYWLRLTRVGNVFTGYISPDGTTWTEFRSVTLPMDESVYIGLAVTSHTSAPQALNAATFEAVTYGAVPPPPAVPVAAPPTVAQKPQVPAQPQTPQLQVVRVQAPTH